MSADDEPDTLTRMTRDALGPDARPAESFDELYRRVHEAKEKAWAKAEPVTVYTTDIHRLNRSFIHAPWWPLLSDEDVRGLDTIRLDLVRVGDTLRSKGGGKFSIDIYHQSVQEIRVTDVSSTTDGALALLAARARADAVTHREQAERLDRIAQLVEEGLKPTELETKRYSYPEYETVKPRGQVGFTDAFRAWWHGETGADPGLGLPTELDPSYPSRSMVDAYTAFLGGRASRDVAPAEDMPIGLALAEASIPATSETIAAFNEGRAFESIRLDFEAAVAKGGGGGGDLGTVRITYRAPGEARSTGGAGGDGYEPVDPLATGKPFPAGVGTPWLEHVFGEGQPPDRQVEVPIDPDQIVQPYAVDPRGQVERLADFLNDTDGADPSKPAVDQAIDLLKQLVAALGSRANG